MLTRTHSWYECTISSPDMRIWMCSFAVLLIHAKLPDTIQHYQNRYRLVSMFMLLQQCQDIFQIFLAGVWMQLYNLLFSNMQENWVYTIFFSNTTHAGPTLPPVQPPGPGFKNPKAPAPSPSPSLLPSKPSNSCMLRILLYYLNSSLQKCLHYSTTHRLSVDCVSSSSFFGFARLHGIVSRS
jgi:hypothetical protein